MCNKGYIVKNLCNVIYIISVWYINLYMYFIYITIFVRIYFYIIDVLQMYAFN